MSRSRIRLVAALLAALVLVLGACGSDEDSETTTDASDGTAAEEATGELAITDVWARTSAEGQDRGAAYMVITGGAEDDALIGASVDASVAGTVEIHETVPADEAEGGDDMGGMGATDDSMAEEPMGEDGSMDGMAEGMTMQPIPELAIPAGEAVTLEPGGYHIMFLDLAAPLEEGQTFDLTLTFEEAGEITVPVEVRDR